MKYSVESSADLVVIAENCKATKDGSLLFIAIVLPYTEWVGICFVAQEVKRFTYFIYLFIYLFVYSLLNIIMTMMITILIMVVIITMTTMTL